MGMDSKKKVQDVKLRDNDLRENPFQTQFGQEIVSIQESFQSRLWREGRPRTVYTSATTLPTSDINIQLTTSAGCELYPLYITLSSDVDCIVTIQHYTNLQDMGNETNGVIYEPVFLKAGTPLIKNYYGEIRYFESGFCRLFMKASTTQGRVWASIYGIEVDTNA